MSANDYFSARAAEVILEALKRNQTTFVTVRSDSMAPLLRRGDQIEIGSIRAEGLTMGDIIVFGEPEDLVVHRFWGIQSIDNGAYLLTRGDRLRYYDALTAKNQLRAIVMGRRRNGRSLSLNDGVGARLNRRLTHLSRLEAKAMRIPLPPSPSGPGRVARYGPVRRLARRLLYAMASLLTSLADRSAR